MRNICSEGLAKDSPKLVNVNVQSLHNKLNKLQYILSTNTDFHFLTISEHWMTESECKAFCIPGYKVAASYCRSEFGHGGVLILAKDHIHIEQLDIARYSVEKSIELCAVLAPQMKSIIIAVYRSPSGNTEVFLNNLNEMLNEIRSNYRNINLFLSGDYNICVAENSSIRDEFLEILGENGLYPIYNQPSRIGGTRCVDNVCADKCFYPLETKTINLHLGDHLAQVLAIQKKQPATKTELIKIML